MGPWGEATAFVLDSVPVLSAPCRATVSGASPLEGVARMRRYELMLVVRPDVPDVVGGLVCLVGVAVIMYWPRTV